MMACPKTELISAYVDDALNASTKQKIDAHLKSCSICQEQVRHFKELNLSIQEWADNRVQRESEISASYEDVVPSHLEKMTIPESDKIFGRLVRELQNTPQKVLWFRPQHFGIREEYLMWNQKIEESIIPEKRIEIAAFSGESRFCQKLSSYKGKLNFTFTVGSRTGSDLGLFISGKTEIYPGRKSKITLIPTDFLLNLELEWNIQQQEEDRFFVLMTVHFDEQGWLEDERFATIPQKEEKKVVPPLLEYLIAGGELVEALKVEVED